MAKRNIDSKSDKHVMRRSKDGCISDKTIAGSSLSQSDKRHGNVSRVKGEDSKNGDWTKADRAMFRAWDKVYENRSKK